MKEFLNDRDRVLWTIWCLIGLFLVLSMCPRCLAAEEAGPPAAVSSGVDAVEDSEEAAVDAITSSAPLVLENEKKDPFKALIIRKQVEPPTYTRTTTTTLVATFTPPAIPPLQVQVMGICGNDQGRWALAVFENQPRVLAPEMVVEGKFKVMEILADRLVVFSFRDNLRRVFKIEGGEK